MINATGEVRGRGSRRLVSWGACQERGGGEKPLGQYVQEEWVSPGAQSRAAFWAEGEHGMCVCEAWGGLGLEGMTRDCQSSGHGRPGCPASGMFRCVLALRAAQV